MDEIIKITGLNKTYHAGLLRKKRVQAIKNFSLTIERGEVFCLIGPNGAGKTTLVRLLLGFLLPDSGTIAIFQKPNTDTEMRSHLGYLPENACYPSHLTVEQFLRFWASFSDVDSIDIRRKVPEVLDLVRLTDRADSRINELSKGLKLRLGLAQALIHNPRLLIMDEPTDGLDALGRIHFRDTIKQLSAAGQTIFMNSHLLSEVEKVSVRIGIIKEGTLLKVDNTANLLPLEDSFLSLIRS